MIDAAFAALERALKNDRSRCVCDGLLAIAMKNDPDSNAKIRALLANSEISRGVRMHVAKELISGGAPPQVMGLPALFTYLGGNTADTQRLARKALHRYAPVASDLEVLKAQVENGNDLQRRLACIVIGKLTEDASALKDALVTLSSDNDSSEEARGEAEKALAMVFAASL